MGDSEKSISRTLGSSFVTVSFEQDGSVAVIGLDDGKANAISLDVLAAVDAGLAKASDGGASAVLHHRASGPVLGGLRPLGHDRR